MVEYIPDESVNLIYLDPPFNSKRIYNAFIGGAQWVAFDDTWRWYEAIDDFHSVASDVTLAPTMEGLRRVLGEGAELAYLSYMANRLRECRRILMPTGSIYLHCDPTMSHYLKIVMDGVFGKNNYKNEVIWHYRKWSTGKYTFQRNHDVLFFYSRSGSRERAFNQLYMPRTASTLKRFGRKRIISGYDEAGQRLPSQVSEEDSEGVRLDDVWDIARVPPIKQLYPTEKPLALLERIIKASSDPDDIVFDPFCGCGTTIHAAQNLGRRWIGIDVCVQACKVIQKRIEGHFDSLWDDIEFVGMPKTLDDAKSLAAYDPFKFERWAASLAPGMEANKKQRGDKGIDGRGRLPIRKGKFVDVVSQVKAGNSNPSHVQAFNEARRQAGAELGVFTCFEDKVTSGMRNAAVNTGKFLDRWPVIQLYTIEDYFDGRLPDLPLSDFPRP
ncbi:MAG: DNA methyltransferase [Chloroflexota bacterium]|nr:DNA methyltransferase [Chloroflexota bacterium]MDE2947515.1 DNA methyltransferase [Chloroflexota bacterium]